MKQTGVSTAMEVLDSVDLSAADSPRCSDLLGDLKLVRGWLDATEARITARMNQLHDSHGAAPAADLHTRCGGVSAADGKRKERRSRALDDAPAFGGALADGLIGSEHVDANATAKLDDDVKASLLGDTPDLLAAATSMPPDKFARHLRDRTRSLERDNGVERNQRQRNETFLSRKVNLHSGMVEGRFAFHPELVNQVFSAVDGETAAIIAAGERAGDRAFVGRSVDRKRVAAEALGRLVAGGHQSIRPAEADITILVDEQTVVTGELHDHTVCETADGLGLPPASVRRLLCNGRVTPIIVDIDGNALNTGRTDRHANRKQRRALRAMYRTCAFGDCDIAFDRCEMHHLLPWEHGGATDLANLVPICSRHHHVVHELGWVLHLEPDRTLVIEQPDGVEFARTRPDVAEPTRSRHRKRRPAA